MVLEMKEIPTKSYEEIAATFDAMSPWKATKYYQRSMSNRNTPDENAKHMMAYMKDHPEKFLSEEQMRGARSGSWSYGRGFSGGPYYRRSKDRVYDGDGFSYDAYGNRYDGYGRNSDSFSDGGREPFQGYGNPNGFSNWYGAANYRNKPRRRKSKPIGEARSYEEIDNTVRNLKSNVARTRYFMKVQSNPETNPETMQNLARFRNSNPGLFASDQDAIAAGPTMQRRGFWSGLWKPKEEFDSMSPKEQKFFVNAFKRKNRANNTSYSLRVLTNPNTSDEDKDAMVNVVRKNPLLFFRNAEPQNQVPASEVPAKKPAAKAPAKKAARKS